MANKPSKPREDPDRMILPPSGLAEDILGGSPVPGGPEDKAQLPNRLYTFADSMAKSGAGEEAKKAEEQMETWVTFRLDKESFGLPVSHVQEIRRVTTITRVPHAPRPVRGVTNLRGRVLPVVDLRVRLGIPEIEIAGASRVLVVSSCGRLLGLLVDSVSQVARINPNAVQPPPPDVMTAQSGYILGVYHLQSDLAILLDVDRVLLIEESLQAPGPEN